MNIVIGITGASGAIYGIKLIEYLRKKKINIHLVISEYAKKIIENETEYKVNDVISIVEHYYDNTNLYADIASGMTMYDGMVIVPCSMSSLSKISNGIADNLITRVAAVCLKEKRKLILVVRETPLSTIHIENMLTLSRAGAIILPAMPAFYTQPKSVDDMINFVLSRIIDNLNIENTIDISWSST